MTNQPEAAWVEAAREAAGRTFEVLGSMDRDDLDLKLSPLDCAKGTNSADSSFLDYLKNGEHLRNGEFLANAR